MGFRWTPLFNQKGQFFPPFYSWCSAFNPSAHTITNKLKPACVWTGWGLRETQKVILNTSCSNHSSQGEGDPKRRVPQCSLPELRVDVTPWSKSDPGPLCHCMSGEKRAPDDSCICFYTACEARDDIHWWCGDSIIEWWTSSWPPSMGTIGKKWVVGAGHAHRLQAYEGHPTKWKI